MSTDILSDVLRSVRLRGAVFYIVSSDGEWVAVAPASREIANAVMPDAEHLMEYHVVTSGECWLTIDGEHPQKLNCGDVVLLPQGDAHVVSSAPRMRAEANVNSLYEMQRNQRPFHLHYAGSKVSQIDPGTLGESATGRIVCGFIGCDTRPFNPMIASLPKLLYLPAAEDGLGVRIAQLAAAESAQKLPGADALLERLSEMLFVDAVRRHLHQLPQESTGWLAGLRDRFVGSALGLIHERPAYDWTVEKLSREVGLSRSALHERFVELIGQTPIQYLTQWRMQLASRQLRETQASIATIALDVGYRSEAAFARAFKRASGLPPAKWRRLQAGGAQDE